MDGMLPLLVLAVAAGNNNSGNGVNLGETVVFSSNLLPEMPRTLLAITSAQNQIAEQQRRDNDTAKELADLWDKNHLTKLKQKDLDAHPRIKDLINLLSSSDRSKIVDDGAGGSVPGSVAVSTGG